MPRLRHLWGVPRSPVFKTYLTRVRICLHMHRHTPTLLPVAEGPHFLKAVDTGLLTIRARHLRICPRMGMPPTWAFQVRACRPEEALLFQTCLMRMEGGQVNLGSHRLGEDTGMSLTKNNASTDNSTSLINTHVVVHTGAGGISVYVVLIRSVFNSRASVLGKNVGRQ